MTVEELEKRVKILENKIRCYCYFSVTGKPEDCVLNKTKETCGKYGRKTWPSQLEKAERDGLASELLEVQQDCVATNKQLEIAVKALRIIAVNHALYDFRAGTAQTALKEMGLE